ncbi:Rha family transcriptional regulator [Bacillus paralicheniformis]|uniref:Rha family transcriptional regulator n=1 Tax=Bacillus paralicheniformis TaxID=1648923 RepID=UPI003A8B20F7
MENQLVFIKENIAVTDSLTIAEMFGKEHKNVLRDIETQMEYAGEEFNELNFERNSYKDSLNRLKPKYDLTDQELIRSRHMKRSLGSCSKFLDWAEKEGWSTEQIYYVARIVLALLEEKIKF